MMSALLCRISFGCAKVALVVALVGLLVSFDRELCCNVDAIVISDSYPHSTDGEPDGKELNNETA